MTPTSTYGFLPGAMDRVVTTSVPRQKGRATPLREIALFFRFSKTRLGAESQRLVTPNPSGFCKPKPAISARLRNYIRRKSSLGSIPCHPVACVPD